MPGSIRNPESRGCHALLKDGARLIDSAPDLLNALENSPLVLTGAVPLPEPREGGSVPGPGGAESPLCGRRPLDREEEILLDALGFEPQDFDTLVARTGFKPAALAGKLLQLELAGLLELRAGGEYARLGTSGRAPAPAPSPSSTSLPH